MVRLRFGMRTLMVLPVVAGLAVWVMGTIEGCGGTWCRALGRKTIPLDFVVVDAANGQPIPSAVIRFVETVPETVLETGGDGHAHFAYRDAPIESCRYYPPFGLPAWHFKESLVRPQALILG